MTAGYLKMPLVLLVVKAYTLFFTQCHALGNNTSVEILTQW